MLTTLGGRSCGKETPRSWTRRWTTRASAPHRCRLQPRWGRVVAHDRRRPVTADLNRCGVHDAGKWLRRRQRVQGLGFFSFFSSLSVWFCGGAAELFVGRTRIGRGISPETEQRDLMCAARLVTNAGGEINMAVGTAQVRGFSSLSAVVLPPV
ncbi:putative serine/arginine-rich splicing factor SR45 isoform X2 [Iris pallida]|uniref:Serine/arginine-rich splicing factor SR45 isoform X2 n=1 Tax=Iris pallida TaxID=29817 RepID=A0AAX6I3V5_IRIPA|nr:putative serine/arginine-rich splicing factor SR45 isoform X2 [Iris pallida]